MNHDWSNPDSCECGLPMCGSFRPLPDLPSMRESLKPSKLEGDDDVSG